MFKLKDFDYMAEITTLSPEEQVAYDKVRYHYCLQIFNMEEERRELLERKSQFYLSLLALILGAIFLKPEFLTVMSAKMKDSTLSIYIKPGLYVSLIFLAFSLLSTLIATIRSVWLQRYKGVFPEELFESLFDPESKFINEKNESGFYRATAMAIAIALENNVNVNNKKSNWVRFSYYSIIAGVFSLVMLLGIFVFLTLI